MAGVAIRNSLQVVLMFRFRFPEIACRSDLGHDLSRPEAGCVDVRDPVLGNLFLLIGGVKNWGAIAQAAIISLPVQGGRIVNLEKKFQQFAVAHDLRVENDLDRLGVRAVIAIGGIFHIAAGIADARGYHAGIEEKQILNAPEAATCENCAFGWYGHGSTPSNG